MRHAVNDKARCGLEDPGNSKVSKTARPGAPAPAVQDFLTKRFYVLADPVEDLREAEFLPIQFLSINGAINKLVPCLSIGLDVETVAPKEDVGGSEGDPLVAVEEAVIVA